MRQGIFWVAAFINLGFAVHSVNHGEQFYFASHLVVAISMILLNGQMNDVDRKIEIMKDLHEKITYASKVKRKF